MLSLFKKKKNMFNVMIVCTANITRSPYFAHLLAEKAKDGTLGATKKLETCSAGVHAQNGTSAHPVMAIAAQSKKIDLRNHRSRKISPSIVKNIDLILTMEERHKKSILEEMPDLEGKVFMVTEFGRRDGHEDIGDVPDPTGRDVKDYMEFVEFADQEADRVLEVLMYRYLIS